MQKTKSHRRFVVLAIAAVGCFISLATFQNCEGGFKALDSSSVDALAVNQYSLLISSNQPLSSAVNAQTFTFTGGVHQADFASYTCQLDSAAAAACISPYSVSNLLEAHHRLTVQALNASGVPLTASNYDFTVDVTPPQLSFTQAPSGAVGSADVSLTLSATDLLSTISAINCSIDGGAQRTVMSTFSTGALAEGSHNISCLATDAAGNTSAAVKTSWITDLNAPIVTASGKAFSATSNSVTFSASSKSGVSVTTKCSLDNGTSSACQTGQSYSGLSAGQHSITVQATDAAGHSSAAVYTWTVDLTPPNVRISTLAPAYSSAAGLPVTFVIDDGAGSGAGSCQCAMGASAPGAYSACQSPASFSGAVEGAQALWIRCTDAVGNLSSAQKFQTTVDRTPPTLTVTSDVVALSERQSAAFTISGTDAVSTPVHFQMQLDGAAFIETPAQTTLNALADGTHVAVFRALDQAGNASATQTVTWTVDTTPPTAPSSVNYITSTFDDTAGWGASTDTGSGVDHYEIKIGTSAGSDNLLAATVVKAPLGTYQIPSSLYYQTIGGVQRRPFADQVTYVSVRAFDKLGHVSDWSQSGPTNPNLYDDNFPYDAGCSFGGSCVAGFRLDTSAAALDSGKAAFAHYFLVSPNTKVSVQSADMGDPLSELSTYSPGTFTTSCQLGGAAFACDLVGGQVIPGLITETPQKLDVVVYYNQQVFFEVHTTIIQTARVLRFSAPSQSFTNSGALIYTASSLIDLPVRQLWIDGNATSVSIFCWDNGPSKDARVIVRNNGEAYLSAFNSFNTCAASVYVDASSLVVFDEPPAGTTIYAAPGAAIYFKEAWSAETAKLSGLHQLVPATIPAINSCPNSTSGSCPADLKIIQ